VNFRKLVLFATLLAAPLGAAQDMPPNLPRPTTNRGPAVGLTGREMVLIGLGVGVVACVLAGGVLVLIRRGSKT
jgi:hypothetical protein